MGIKFDEGTRESIKWLMGIVASVMIMLIKFTLDTVNKKQEDQGVKLDKVYELNLKHEERIINMERRVDNNEKELREQRMRYWELAGKKYREDFDRQTEEMEKINN